MKRLALLLGSLLVVSAAASAKEVVPAPVVVEEAPVQVVEKEVIVYRDKEEGFRPNGFVSAEYKYYDRTEGQKRIGDKDWNGNNRYSRLQLQTNINFTENQTLDIRTRTYESLDEADYYSKDDQVRVQYYYNHGLLGDTKVNGTSFVEYLNEGSIQSIQYRYDFQFADYMFDNDFIKTTNFVVGPRAIYEWDNDNSSDANYRLGVYFDWINQLPWGFSTEVEIDGFDYTKYTNNRAQKNENGNGRLHDYYHRTDYVDSLDLSVLALVKHDANLYTADKLSIDWHAEAGYDTYNLSNRSRYVHATNNVKPEAEYAKYDAKVVAELSATYKATEFVSVFAGIGAEYKDWKITSEEDATNWRWQPYAWTGFNMTF